MMFLLQVALLASAAISQELLAEPEDASLGGWLASYVSREQALVELQDGNLRGSPRAAAANAEEADQEAQRDRDFYEDDALRADREPEQVGRSFAPARPVLASRVCVNNSAAFVLRMQLWDTDTNVLSKRSRGKPARFQQCINISSIAFIKPFDAVSTGIQAVGGISQNLQTVLYKPYSGMAVFTCKGTTTIYKCSLATQGPAVQAGGVVLPPVPPHTPQPAVTPQSVFAGGICVQNRGVFRLRFRMWDAVTNLFSIYSQKFNTGGSACLTSSSIFGLSPGNPLVLNTAPVGGLVQSSMSVIYHPNARLVNFTCKGATTRYLCFLQQ